MSRRHGLKQLAASAPAYATSITSPWIFAARSVDQRLRSSPGSSNASSVILESKSAAWGHAVRFFRRCRFRARLVSAIPALGQLRSKTSASPTSRAIATPASSNFRVLVTVKECTQKPYRLSARQFQYSFDKSFGCRRLLEVSLRPRRERCLDLNRKHRTRRSEERRVGKE